MLTITEAQLAGLEAAQRERFAHELTQRLRTTGDPSIAKLPDAELLRRVDAGLRVGRHYQVSEERDLMLLALAHVLFGADLLAQPDKSFVAQILGGGIGLNDNRVFRIDQRLRALPG